MTTTNVLSRSHGSIDIISKRVNYSTLNTMLLFKSDKRDSRDQIKQKITETASSKWWDYPV